MSTILQKYFQGDGGAVAARERASDAFGTARRRGKSSARKMKSRFSRKKMQFVRAHRCVHASARDMRDMFRGRLNGA
jgi:hypothetical protein